MREKIRRSALLLLLAALPWLLCACSAKEETLTEITLIHGWGSVAGDHEAMRQIYSDFSAANPDVRINLISMPTTAEAVRKAEDFIMVGNIPDIIFLGGGLGDDLYRYMSQNGVALNIMPFLEANPALMASVNPANLNYWTAEDGYLYNISDVLSLCGGYWYDQDIMAAAGIDSLPQTWDEFIAMCKKINAWAQQENNGLKALQTSPEGYLFFMNHLLAAEDAPKKNHLYCPDDALMRKVFKTLQVIYDQSMNEADHYSYLDETSRFNSGKLALYVNGVWAAYMIAPDKNVSYALLPGEGETTSCLSAGLGYVLGKTGDAAREQASVRFIEYMLSPQVQARILEETQQVPANPTIDMNKYAGQYERLCLAAQTVIEAQRKIEIPSMPWTNTQFRLLEGRLFSVLSGQLKLQTLLDLLK